MRGRRSGPLQRDDGLQRDGGFRRGWVPPGVGGLGWFLPLGLVLLAVPAFGQGRITEVSLFRTGESLRVVVRAHDLLDERTTQTIESGLPGICTYLLRLEDSAGRLVAQRFVERSLRYRLWSNRYLLESEGDSLALPTLAAGDSAISRLANCDVCPLSRLRPTEEYRLTLQIVAGPFAADDRVGLQRYVLSNSLGAAQEGVVDLNVLLGHAVEEKGESRQVIASTSPSFRVGELKEAP